MRIGDVAARAGVGVDTLRYYERRGLLAEPTRSESSGYREYSSDVVAHVRFIKRAQDLGFSLAEIDGLMRLRVGRAGNRVEVRSLAESKLTTIDEKIAHLRSMRDALHELLELCSSGRENAECPILGALEGHRLPIAVTRKQEKADG